MARQLNIKSANYITRDIHKWTCDEGRTLVRGHHGRHVIQPHPCPRAWLVLPRQSHDCWLHQHTKRAPCDACHCAWGSLTGAAPREPAVVSADDATAPRPCPPAPRLPLPPAPPPPPPPPPRTTWCVTTMSGNNAAAAPSRRGPDPRPAANDGAVDCDPGKGTPPRVTAGASAAAAAAAAADASLRRR